MLTVVLVWALTSCSSEHQSTTKNTSSSDEGSISTEVAAAAESAMKENHLKAVLVRVTQNGQEVASVVRGESMTGVPATEDMHFRNGAVAISYLGTVLL